MSNPQEGRNLLRSLWDLLRRGERKIHSFRTVLPQALLPWSPRRQAGGIRMAAPSKTGNMRLISFSTESLVTVIVLPAEISFLITR